MMGWNEFVPPHFSISGLVAQLGERSVRIREVVGSTPIRSTIKSCEILCFTAFCDFFKDLSRMRTERIRLSLEEVKYHKQIKKSLRGVKHRNPHQMHPKKNPGTAPYSVMPGFKLTLRSFRSAAGLFNCPSRQWICFPRQKDNRLNGIPFVPQKLRNFPAILEHRKIQTNPL